jgi:hypothetical protein
MGTLDGLVAIVTVARATVADGIVHSLEEGNGRGLRKARLIQRRDLTSPFRFTNDNIDEFNF